MPIPEAGALEARLVAKASFVLFPAEGTRNLKTPEVMLIQEVQDKLVSGLTRMERAIKIIFVAESTKLLGLGKLKRKVQQRALTRKMRYQCFSET